VCDLSPETILLDSEFTPKLTQFANAEVAVISSDDVGSVSKVTSLKQMDLKYVK
jgi:hypothetical protein